MALSILCDVYRSSRVDGMYLYVAREEGLDRVPESLMKRFGRAEPALSLALTLRQKLSRANAADVMHAIQEQGFYLQMPPKEGEWA
ncbi:MAG TPA: YcgL domain-containing protein [Pseudomonadales bacterium]